MNRSLSLLVLALFLLIGGTFAQLFHKSGHCPLRNSVTNCNPRCMSDSQCSLNEKCCPNKCGYTSCAQPSAVSTGKDGGYKGSSNQAVYCNGVKCGPYEKCQFDRNTKRDKCVRT